MQRDCINSVCMSFTPDYNKTAINKYSDPYGTLTGGESDAAPLSAPVTASSSVVAEFGNRKVTGYNLEVCISNSEQLLSYNFLFTVQAALVWVEEATRFSPPTGERASTISAVLHQIIAVSA